MTHTAAQAKNIAMKGNYSLSTLGAKHVINQSTPLVLAAIEKIKPEERDRPFTFADMGCADGGTSLEMVSEAVQAIQALAPHRSISLVYSDQLRNDYNALFHIVYGASQLESPLAALENIHIMASATSFYRQILPTNTLNLGFSATAMHWLSRKPGNISNHLQAVGAEGEELAAFRAQGLQDWQMILLNRAKELVPGGRMVMANFGRDEAGRYLGHTEGVNMFDTFRDLWLQFVAEGIITQDEFIEMTLPQYYKSVEEFSAPLTDPNNPVYQAGLRLESLETGIVKCPYAADFQQHGDPAAFAKAYIPTLRSWTESTFFGGLSENRSLEERWEIINRYYDAYEAMVRDNPAGHGMDYIHIYMTVVKAG